MQQVMFSVEEFLTGNDLAEYQAKVFTAKNITQCSGLGSFINHNLSANNNEAAYKYFKEAFMSYGFGYPNGISFMYGNKTGRINYNIDGIEKETQINSKELFEILLDNLN